MSQQVQYNVCVASSQEKEMEKQKILYQQARLHARGAAEMVLQMISATKGDNEFSVLKEMILSLLDHSRMRRHPICFKVDGLSVSKLPLLSSFYFHPSIF